MNPSNLNVAWSGFRVVLREDFSFNDIKEIVGLAGIDITTLSRLVQRAGGGATKGQLMDALDAEIGTLGEDERRRVLVRLAEAMVERRDGVGDKLAQYLYPLGWNLAAGRLVRTEVLDVRDIGELPEEARTDISKAASRFQDGDYSGALAAACAAVDSATAAIYDSHSLGDPTKHGFQEKCSKALRAATKDRVVSDLSTLAWQEHDAKKLADNMIGSLNQGAYVMQALRSKMSDVHGTKAVLRALVFDSLKWASLILSALK